MGVLLTWAYGGGGWWWFSPLWMLPWLIFLGVAIWLVSRGGWWGRSHRSGGDRAREILAERYARGEVSTEEYRERMEQLG